MHTQRGTRTLRSHLFLVLYHLDTRNGLLQLNRRNIFVERHPTASPIVQKTSRLRLLFGLAASDRLHAGDVKIPDAIPGRNPLELIPTTFSLRGFGLPRELQSLTSNSANSQSAAVGTLGSVGKYQTRLDECDAMPAQRERHERWIPVMAVSRAHDLHGRHAASC